MYAIQTILNKIQTSKSIDFGELFNESLGVYKKSMGSRILTSVVFNTCDVAIYRQYLFALFYTCN